MPIDRLAVPMPASAVLPLVVPALQAMPSQSKIVLPAGQVSAAGAPAMRLPETVKLAFAWSSPPAPPLPGVGSLSGAGEAALSAQLETGASALDVTLALYVSDTR